MNVSYSIQSYSSFDVIYPRCETFQQYEVRSRTFDTQRVLPRAAPPCSLPQLLFYGDSRRWRRGYIRLSTNYQKLILFLCWYCCWAWTDFINVGRNCSDITTYWRGEGANCAYLNFCFLCAEWIVITVMITFTYFINSFFSCIDCKWTW